MSVSPGFLAYVLEQLERSGPVTARNMFGGAGLYREGLFFGLIDSGDRFYLKVDESNRADFEGRGSDPFNPYGAQSGKLPMSYMSVPEDVLEDPDELALWTRRSMAVAARGKRR